MRAVKGRDTTPELAVRRILREAGVGYRLGGCGLPGRPDLVMKGRRVAIFVHGCFWHGHGCHLFKWPQTRPEFWRQKIGRNCEVDEKALERLLSTGWRVAVVWECALKGSQRWPMAKVVDACQDWLLSSATTLEIPMDQVAGGDESQGD